jgi:hypothetical protein
MEKKEAFEKSRLPAFWGPNYDSVLNQDHGGNLLMGLQTMDLQADDGKIMKVEIAPKSRARDVIIGNTPLREMGQPVQIRQLFGTQVQSRMTQR